MTRLALLAMLVVSGPGRTELPFDRLEVVLSSLGLRQEAPT
jgi:hypothetical protein